MKEKPVILVTNDDGITAPGIRALVEAVKPFGRIVIVAPDRPQSGMGHAITVNKPLRLSRSLEYGDLEAYSCSGTPVDCVKLAIYEVLKASPDLIVSGVNHGSNCSTNVLYSGTMSAAVEGAIEGVPSIGFSLLDHSVEADFSASVKVARRVVEQVLENGMPEGVCFNVNIPKLPYELIRGLKVCRQAKAFWEDNFETRKDPFGREYYWLTGEFKNYDGSEETDVWALDHDYVSLVPVQFDMTAHAVVDSLRNLKF